MQSKQQVIIVGAGPAGLMAAEQLSLAGYQVRVYDAKPSACRKFLLAGTSGMNITHSEPYGEFIQRYYDKAAWLDGALRQFDADALRNWCQGLGVSTFVGSSGRVFTEQMKAAPLVRNWLKRLRAAGVEFYMRHRLVAIQGTRLELDHNGETIRTQADAVLLALGGASWPKLGSDGLWQSMLAEQQIEQAPLRAANCGMLCDWSEHLKQQHAGSPLKNVRFKVQANGQRIEKHGECVISQTGMEGSLVYAFSRYLREQLEECGQAQLHIDLLPDQNLAQLSQKLAKKRSKESFAKYLKRSAGLSGVKAALLYECQPHPQQLEPAQLAACIKALPVQFYATKPVDEAISSAGGVCQHSVDAKLMLNNLPGVFCAGEMLDWEAPTGGYLLTACFATGHLAAQGIARYLSGDPTT
ncbi:TIGR03862 family flavoprotein [Bowmanella pacifica]|uniref:NAD(FAD)-utilizing dehydrogenase n=1 Tax=Bowmanella pacifica TaxID=502051 RepID=A0A918DGT2_9ALTE|nr:TIGR03862 family flavoprotein [Bowmanella pacifica]GGO66168.1 NAD(FAD)-utilizing dehydrogenase [Bowmanella pacifica]